MKIVGERVLEIRAGGGSGHRRSCWDPWPSRKGGEGQRKRPVERFPVFEDEVGRKKR